MNLNVYILPALNLIFSQVMLKIVAYQMLIATNVPVNSATIYPIAVYAIYYSLINPCGYWTKGTLFALVSNRNTLYKEMGVKTHLSVSVELR